MATKRQPRPPSGLEHGATPLGRPSNRQQLELATPQQEGEEVSEHELALPDRLGQVGAGDHVVNPKGQDGITPRICAEKSFGVINGLVSGQARCDRPFPFQILAFRGTK